MKKVVRDWEFADSVKLEQRRVAVLPGCEVLADGEQYSDGDMTKIYNDVEFVSVYHVEENNVSKLTKEQFNKLSESEQIDYINELGNFYCDCDLVEKADVSVIDLDSDTEIENLYDYLLDLNAESTDLQGRCFADDGVELIDEIVAEHITNINDYDTVQEFLNSIKQALCDGEYLATLDTDESTVEQAYSMLDNGEYELNKGVILNQYIDQSGTKVNFLIDKLGINRTTYYRKIENDFNFSRSELMTIKEVLNLTDEQFLKLF